MSDNIVQLRRRWTGATTAPVPAAVKSGELIIQGAGANVIVYLGTGDAGDGTSTAVEAVAGRGAVVMLTGAQSVDGLKTFTVSPQVPTAANDSNDGTVASTAFVKSALAVAVSAVNIADGSKGDITVSNNGATWTIPAGTITLNKMQSIASGTFIGRTAVGAGAPQALTIAEVQAALGTRDAAMLNAGTLDAARLPAMTGDVTAAAGTYATSIKNGVVTLAKMAGIGAYTLLGNNTSGTGTPAALSVANVMAMLAAAPLASPAFTGLPTAPTAAAGTKTTQIATTAFVSAAVAAVIGSAPETLDTLTELAAALGNDPNYATTLATTVGSKLDKSANLSDLANVPSARNNLGLGTLALQNANLVSITGGTLANVTLVNATIDAGAW